MGTRRVPILVTRRYDAVNAIYGQGLLFLFFDFFAVLCRALSVILSVRRCGIDGGLLAPLCPPSAGAARPCTLSRVPRLTIPANHRPVLHFIFPLYNRLSLCYNIHAPTE